MKQCLLLGGNGFIGSHLAEELVAHGFNVTIFDSREDLRTDLRSRDFTYVRGDFRNEADIGCALEGIDYVFHFISTTTPGSSAQSPVYDLESNVITTVRLLQQCCEAGIKKVIFPSSGGTIYGEPERIPIRETDPIHPVHPYAISKMTIEMYLHSFYRMYGLDYLILRYANPYGERQMPFGNQGVIPIFLYRIMQRESPIIYGDGSMVRDYIYIHDLVDVTVSLVEKGSSERVFNVGSGSGTSVTQLIEIMADVTGMRVVPVFRDPPSLSISKIVLDISRVKEMTGWIPRTGMQEGIRRTHAWLKTVINKG